ncbi:copper homeostasis membrane protein CopD [Blastomonas aquatica]|uniref:Copper resistance protein CopD n=1 Tax=Blastomonas aquatica TaxID=1510276 RepID=A0ABQ1J7R5_9SPHN|nr:copper homeostasis membrane protein CopD [Blastomonas aquatica]GGB62060.1 copper resistance protein CopD [Blastomonas aquatica]
MPTDWLHPALRFAQYAALLGLFGATAFHAYRLRELVGNTSTMRLRPIAIAAMAAPVISLAVMLVGIAAMMGQPLSELELETIKSMVFSTQPGWAFLVRTGLLMLALAALLSIKPMVPRHIAAASGYGLALSTLAWNGHAAATEGALGLVHRLNDGLHLLAAGLWIGAICWFTTLVFAAHRHPDRARSERLRVAMEGFAPLGITLVSIVVVTGVLNAHFIFGLEKSLKVLGTPYGVLLAGKALLVAIMVMCAARNAGLVRSDRGVREEAAVGSDGSLRALRASLAVELLLATFVVGLVALAGLASPMG